MFVSAEHTRSFHNNNSSHFVSGILSCKNCNLEFSTKKEYNAHVIFSHKTESPAVKKILILGGGFAGINIFETIQKKIPKDVSVTLVNEENYFLFTPMLPEVAAGLLHPSNITIPIRTFRKNARFYQASVSSIDLNQKLVTIVRTFDGKVHALEYDYLVLALGGKNNFYGNRSMEEHSFTIKTIEDAISIKNHIINMLENASQTGDIDLQKKFLTFMVVGAGFAGVETIGELNHFVRSAVNHAYPSINNENIRMILVSARERILPEVGEKLGNDALLYLEKVGVEVIKKTKAVDCTEDTVQLSNGENIPCTTLIWAGGVAIDPVITSLDCEHGQGGKVVVDEYLRLKSHHNVFALGDCAAIKDSATGNHYPPTAQHAIRESKIVANNLLNMINEKNDLQKFSYQSKGMMATIGNRVGVVSLFGHSLKGTPAWLVWRTYYIMRIPTLEKKIKIAFDWAMDLFFKRDLTLVGQIRKKELHTIHIGYDMPTLKEQLFVDL